MRILVTAAFLLLSFISSECFAAGCVSGNCVNGNGTYRWDGGAQYSGDWQNQQKHGYGTYIYEGGEKYTGSWVNNQKHGQGTYMWPGGYQFTGNWEKNVAHGRGIYTYPNGEKFSQVMNRGQLVSEERLSSQSQAPPAVHNPAPQAAPRPITPSQAPVSMPSGKRWKKAN